MSPGVAVQACGVLETPLAPSSHHIERYITSIYLETGLSSLDRKWEEDLLTSVCPSIQSVLSKYWVNTGIFQWLLLLTPTSGAQNPILYNLVVAQL